MQTSSLFGKQPTLIEKFVSSHFLSAGATIHCHENMLRRNAVILPARRQQTACFATWKHSGRSGLKIAHPCLFLTQWHYNRPSRHKKYAEKHISCSGSPHWTKVTGAKTWQKQDAIKWSCSAGQGQTFVLVAHTLLCSLSMFAYGSPKQ